MEQCIRGNDLVFIVLLHITNSQHPAPYENILASMGFCPINLGIVLSLRIPKFVLLFKDKKIPKFVTFSRKKPIGARIIAYGAGSCPSALYHPSTQK